MAGVHEIVGTTHGKVQDVAVVDHAQVLAFASRGISESRPSNIGYCEYRIRLLIAKGIVAGTRAGIVGILPNVKKIVNVVNIVVSLDIALHLCFDAIAHPDEHVVFGVGEIKSGSSVIVERNRAVGTQRGDVVGSRRLVVASLAIGGDVVL